MKYRAFVLVGPPGSGKGTQGRALSATGSFFHCSCGDVFRALDRTSELGRVFQEYAAKGLLVPDNIVVDVWVAHVTRCERERKFSPGSDYLLLDGIPRNEYQARLMAALIEVIGVLHFDGLNRAELLSRLRKRALQENRVDDARDEVIQRRIDIYEREARELLAHYPADMIYPLQADHEKAAVANQVNDAVCKTIGNKGFAAHRIGDAKKPKLKTNYH
jgi:adenylate kinase